MKKHKHFIPLTICIVLIILFSILRLYTDSHIYRLIDCFLFLFAAISLPYAVIIEAEKFRKKGKYKTVYRLTFAAGFICFAFLQSAIDYFFDFLK